MKFLPEALGNLFDYVFLFVIQIKYFTFYYIFFFKLFFMQFLPLFKHKILIKIFKKKAEKKYKILMLMKEFIFHFKNFLCQHRNEKQMCYKD